MLSKRQVTTATAIAVIVAAFAIAVTLHQSATPVGGAVSATHFELGVDRRAARLDELIDLAVLEARRWNRDAVMVALSAAGVRGDGSVDLESSEVVIWVVSPTRVKSLSAVRRLEGLREYRFTANGLGAGVARSGLGEGWDRWKPPPRPRCRVSELAPIIAPDERTFAIRVERQPSAEHPGDWWVDIEGVGPRRYRMTDCARRRGPRDDKLR